MLTDKEYEAAMFKDLPEYTCGQCNEVFGSNCDEDDIECTNCDARLCPHCGQWFGGQA
jgi:hypothetical protein